jgi:protein phosphatase PTC7
MSFPPPNYQCIQDSPEKAETTSFGVCEGDIILVATDGLFDNLPTQLIEKEFSHFGPEVDLNELQRVCNSLALQARRLAFDPEFVSPFAKKAISHGYRCNGGKPDDITVILSLVTKVKKGAEEPPETLLDDITSTSEEGLTFGTNSLTGRQVAKL